jgi:hypothetical protein
MSKDLFYLMRSEEIATSNFLPTKKEVTKSSTQFAQDIVDNGEHNIQELFSQVVRIEEAIKNIKDVFKNSLPQENFEAFGLKGLYRSGGAVLNYSEDEYYADLQSQLKHRESLLKVASESPIELYDENGVLVPRVSKTERKSSLAISF